MDILEATDLLREWSGEGSKYFSLDVFLHMMMDYEDLGGSPMEGDIIFWHEGEAGGVVSDIVITMSGLY